MPDPDLSKLDDREFLEAIYFLVLDRPIDLQGLLSGLDYLGAGGNRARFLDSLRNSAESRRRRSVDGASGSNLGVQCRKPETGGGPAIQGLRKITLRLIKLAASMFRYPAVEAARISGDSKRGLAAPSNGSTSECHTSCPVAGRGQNRGGLSRPAVRSGDAKAPSLELTRPPPLRWETLLSRTAAGLPPAMNKIESANATQGTGNDHCRIEIGPMVGCWLEGRSFNRESPVPIGVVVMGRLLGGIVPDAAMEQAGGAAGRFRAMLGGIVHFSALTPALDLVCLEHTDGTTRTTWHLRDAWAEALSFSPMKALGRLPDGQQLGRMLSAELVEGHDLLLTLEASTANSSTLGACQIEAYQIDAGGELLRLARHPVPQQGQTSTLPLPLLDPREPVLLVVTDLDRRIIATDCIPLPTLLEEAQVPLLDYHSILTGGQSILDVATKIGRAHLDAALRARLGHAPRRFGSERCVVLLYSRDHHDFLGETETRSIERLGVEAGFIDQHGVVHFRSGERGRLEDLPERWPDHDLLLVEARSRLRPDFWASLAGHGFRWAQDVDVIHWDVLLVDGLSRPLLAKTGLLLDEAFKGQDLAPLRSALFSRQFIKRWSEPSFAPLLPSAPFAIEHWLCSLPSVAAIRVPQVMETADLPALPASVASITGTEHLPLATRMPVMVRDDAAGISVVINYRNGVEDTVRCLGSLRNQRHDGPVEVVLVNNRSSSAAHQHILSVAHDLFGADRVQSLDFPEEFNHSAQCNLAAKVSRLELLLMLSNDSGLLSSSALSTAARLAKVPWVATVGFRIIDAQRGAAKLQSLGLGLAPRQLQFFGGSPLATYRPPAQFLNLTLETLGNTFAAAMVRRDLYLELGGLDESAFPTNYNDVDFCCRAMQRGYRHISIGSEIVQHVGRGSREMDLDLPIDQRILERCPDLSRLNSVGVASL